MGDLPLFKTTQGCEINRLKARISELEATVVAISKMAFDATVRCNTTLANIKLKEINEELKVLYHTPKESLLLHDAALLESEATRLEISIEETDFDSGYNFALNQLDKQAALLRQRAESGDE